MRPLGMRKTIDKRLRPREGTTDYNQKMKQQYGRKRKWKRSADRRLAVFFLLEQNMMQLLLEQVQCPPSDQGL
jgi:hypothetical protein